MAWLCPFVHSIHFKPFKIFMKLCTNALDDVQRKGTVTLLPLCIFLSDFLFPPYLPDLYTKSWKEKLQFFSKKHWSYWYSYCFFFFFFFFCFVFLLVFFCGHLLTSTKPTYQRQEALFCLDSQGSYTRPLWSYCLLIRCKYSCYWKTHIQCIVSCTTKIPHRRICRAHSKELLFSYLC